MISGVCYVLYSQTRLTGYLRMVSPLWSLLFLDDNAMLPPQCNKVRFLALLEDASVSERACRRTDTRWGSHASRRLGLLPMHLGKEPLKPLLQLLVLGALVELADKVPSRPERVTGKLQRRVAEILFPISKRRTTFSSQRLPPMARVLKGQPGQLTMLPAWSRKALPLVFMSLW